MNKKKIIATVVMIVALIMILVITLNKEEEQPASGFEAHRIVAHAMGELTAIRIPMLGRVTVANYERGTRVFEVDFCYRRMISWLLDMNGQAI